jgi:hypothetical protein
MESLSKEMLVDGCIIMVPEIALMEEYPVISDERGETTTVCWVLIVSESL